MKNFSFRFLGFAATLLPSFTAYAQPPVPVPYLITSACPASANNPSILRMVPPTGVPSVVGTVNLLGVPIIVNGLGSSSTDPANVYAMSTVTSGAAALTPPRFYRIRLDNAAATLLGVVTAPPAPANSGLNIGLSFVVNQAADGGPNSNYFLTGVSLRYNILTNTVNTVRLYLGEISLAPVPNPVAPTWRLVNTSDPAATTIINSLTAQANAFLAGTGPLPDGGFQDIAYVAANNTIITYLALEQKFVVVSNISTSPVATVTTPAVLLPTSGGSLPQIGSLYRDGGGNFFGLRSATGRAYKIDPINGNYLGVTYFPALGCTLGDGTTAPGEEVLPLTLIRFDATAATGGVQLAWQTASEENVEQFVVERSADGRIWTDGPAVPATNQVIGARYGVLDRDRPAAVRYYRLRMEDRDGTRAWSEVQAVKAKNDQEVALLPAWPNPTRASFAVELTAPEAGEAQLINQLGQSVWRAPLINGRADADVRTLSPGIYELVVRYGAGQTARQRVVVAHE